ncbi:hypothetical protein A5672_14165 [Mycobacterium alsense]|uniref:Uncharacterized protein n=1 Tax=Mycobacterium alsense TaxID=324058 RepID=A0ABD6P247_9MYCO|nr:MmpS family transport accessory protein [Mycobacterium alsense]OBG40091.1 hypothetical protein A5672_14165 [Mycobacterium alsense]
MNDPRRPGWSGPPPPGSGLTGPQGYPYPPPADPAYADQAGPYAPSYGGQFSQWSPGQNDTKELPSYWRRELPPQGEAPPEGSVPPPPGGPRSPRWLWFGAGAAALLVVALVIALVLANDAVKTQTAVPPLPAMPGSSEETPTPAPSTRRPSRTPRPAPPPSASLTPTETPVPGAMEDVVYSVTGEGRAISIVYIGTGDVVQTEFNVALPWSKQVSLSKTAAHPANVTVVNFGHDVTCSVTVAGVQVTQRVGVGLTVCDTRG